MSDGLTPTQQAVLEALQRERHYVGAGRVAELSGLSLAEVRAALVVLAQQGLVVRSKNHQWLARGW